MDFRVKGCGRMVLRFAVAFFVSSFVTGRFVDGAVPMQILSIKRTDRTIDKGRGVMVR